MRKVLFKIKNLTQSFKNIEENNHKFPTNISKLVWSKKINSKE